MISVVTQSSGAVGKSVAIILSALSAANVPAFLFLLACLYPNPMSKCALLDAMQSRGAAALDLSCSSYGLSVLQKTNSSLEEENSVSFVMGCK